MAEFNSATYLRERSGASPIGGGHGLVGVLRCKSFEVTLSAAAATDDTMNFGYMPKGSVVQDYKIEASADMDTGGPTLTIDVGHAANSQQVADPDRFFAATTVGQALANTPFRGPGATYATAGRKFKFLEDTLITGLVKAEATTPAEGTIVVTFFYTQEDFDAS